MPSDWQRARDESREANRFQQRVHVRWVWLDAPEGSSFSPLLPTAALERVRAGEEVFAETDTAGSPTFVPYSPLSLEGRPRPIELTGALGSRQDHLQRGLALVTAGTLVLALFFFLAATAIGRRLLGRPIEALSGLAQRIGRGDLDARVTLPGSDELGQLATVLNGMAGSLQRARAELLEASRARLAHQRELLSGL